MTTDPQIIGLFEGFGGLTRAVQDVVGGELIAYAEVEPAACRVLEHHNPGTPNLGDVTAIDWSQVYVDARRRLILTGGFPCTDVSSAGKQLGLRPGTRSGLWHHMSYAIAQLRPDLVVIENVRGLLTARGAEPTADLLAAWAARDRAARALDVIESKLRRARREGNMLYVHRHQRDRARILGRRRAAVAAAKRADALIVRAIAVVLGDLAQLGYDARWYGLRAADVGAPHARFRVFILAWPAADADGALRGGLSDPPERSEVGGAAAERSGQSNRGGITPAADTDGVGSVRGGRARRRRPGPTDGGLVAAADAAGTGREGPRREPAGGGPERGDRAVTDADGGELQRRRVGGVLAGPESAGDGERSERERDRDTARDGSAAAADTDGDGLREQRSGPGWVARDNADGCGSSGSGRDWGAYGPAVCRWEHITGRAAPAPTVRGARGGQQLSPLFVEWMMGLPAGHVTGVPGLSRAAQLKMLGNGVVPQQAAWAIEYLLEEEAAWAAA